MTAPAVVIYVVDDDEAVRDSLQALLESKGFATAAYASAEAFLEAYRPGPADCALFDLRMAGMDGISLLERLRADGRRLPVILITGHGDVPAAVRAMQAGASDFIEKPYASEALLASIARVLETGSRSAGGTAEAREAAARIAALTPREREVLDRLVLGRPNKIIAHELAISPRTVEIHRANLMKKMQADSLSHLVRMALSAGVAATTR
ncbi:MAG: response regulator [Alphaproteobacteria bacterium]|nr:response regulator [Alphaproteobacteria bacterium]